MTVVFSFRIPWEFAVVGTVPQFKVPMAERSINTLKESGSRRAAEERAALFLWTFSGAQHKESCSEVNSV